MVDQIRLLAADRAATQDVATQLVTPVPGSASNANAALPGSRSTPISSNSSTVQLFGLQPVRRRLLLPWLGSRLVPATRKATRDSYPRQGKLALEFGIPDEHVQQSNHGIAACRSYGLLGN
ncbi:hypothetical protein NKH36_33750 [Mesorhizobium sp. M1312]|uniref:hypothetical protein n=1 Tax=unclassified Mesorhizobium TaxID=325217 RepID=UPI00333A0C32